MVSQGKWWVARLKKRSERCNSWFSGYNQQLELVDTCKKGAYSRTLCYLTGQKMNYRLPAKSYRSKTTTQVVYILVVLRHNREATTGCDSTIWYIPSLFM